MQALFGVSACSPPLADIHGGFFRIDFFNLYIEGGIFCWPTLRFELLGWQKASIQLGQSTGPVHNLHTIRIMSACIRKISASND
jgi:hypothetical protein